jgi:predicted RNA-binding Zn-ribbon protein involved in translation (DUF1610 family)
MLVTCPECKKQISEYAKSCPNCGLPQAGGRSKERNDEYVRRVNISGKRNGMPFMNCLSCGKIVFGSKFIKAELATLEVGYGVRYLFKCPSCGGVAERTIVYD